MNTHRIVVPAYGDWKEWSPRLGTFLKHLRRHEPLREVVLISDGESKWPDEALHGLEMLEVPDANDVPTFSYLNMSGILLAYAAIHLSPCLVLTLDCEVKKPIPWGEWTAADVAFGRDMPARRKRWIKGMEFEELSVAVAWFGNEEPGHVFLWDWEIHGALGPGIGCNFWEQVVWSYVWKRYASERRALYPDELNWSHNLDSEQAIIRHYHGLGAKDFFDQL